MRRLWRRLLRVCGQSRIRLPRCSLLPEDLAKGESRVDLPAEGG
jgi:hypothetical protein